MITLALALLAGLTLAAPESAAQGVPLTIESNAARMQFSIVGPSLSLDRIENLMDGTSIDLMSGSGAWSLRFVSTSIPTPGAHPPSVDPSHWIEVDANGLSGTSVDWPWDLPLVTVQAPPVQQLSDTLVLRWRGKITYEPSTGVQVVPFEFETTWRCLENDPIPAVGFRLTTAAPPPPSSGDVPLLYVSSLRFPTIEVPQFPADDALLVPYFGGALVRDPTSTTPPFPSAFGKAPNKFTLNVAAYQGTPLGAEGPVSFVLWDGDHGNTWKTLLLGAETDAPGPRVWMSFEHVPEDVFTPRTWVAPYTLRPGIVAGDWWDVAVAYQDDLVRANVPWYRGPVSSPGNPRQPFVKQLQAQTWFIPAHEGDNLDLIGRQMANANRVLGPGVTAAIYGGYAPGEFDAWLLDGAYLDPGRPTFAGAVREVQRHAGNVALPYVNGAALIDYDMALGMQGTPTQDQLDAYDAFIRDEEQQIVHHAALPLGLACPASPWWFDWLLNEIVTIRTFTDTAGVYLDYFLTGVCYSDDHHADGHADAGHEPGGGDYVFGTRSAQLQAVKAAFQDDFVIAIEFLMGRWTDFADIMHVDIERSVFPTPVVGACLGNPPKEELYPHCNAVTVPLFRATHDDVKLSRIADPPRVARPDRLAWIEASHVFTFGQIPEVTRPAFEQWPIFSNRFGFAPSYPYLSSLTDAPDKALVVPGEDEGVGLPVGPDAASMDRARFERYLSSIVLALRGYDASSVFGVDPNTILGNSGIFFDQPRQGPAANPFQIGLHPWHDGSLRRPPVLRVSAGGGSVSSNPATIPSVEPRFDDGFTTTPIFTEVPFVDPDNLPATDDYLRAFVPHGMYQAPFDLVLETTGAIGGVSTAPTVSGPPTPPPTPGAPPGLGGPAGPPPGPPTPPTSPLAGSLAFIVTNPWIAGDAVETFTVEFDFDPEQYPGWSDSMHYTVTFHRVTGGSEILTGKRQGPWASRSEMLSPGEIAWWIFRPTLPSGS